MLVYRPCSKILYVVMATKILKINQRARDDVSQNDHDILIMSF